MSVEDLITKHVSGADLRSGFEGQRSELKQRMSRLVAGYRLEQGNPHNADKAATLALLERDIKFVAWAIEDIDARLAGADDALNGRKPNRAERRRKERKVQEGTE